MLNLNIVNLDPEDWKKEDWQDAYNLYCVQNIYGPKTKREYYNFVISNHERLKSVRAELSEDLRNKWTGGFISAAVWAKKHKCNMNGELLENCRPEINLEDLQNDVKDLQWQMMHKRG